jgi:exopolysaccharide biosynthesis polyprenyl glycosylphosphotransferase
LADGLQALNEPSGLIEADGLAAAEGTDPGLVDVSATAASASPVVAQVAPSGCTDSGETRALSRLSALRSAAVVLDLTAITMALVIAARGWSPVTVTDILLFLVAYPAAVLTLLTRPVATWDDGSFIDETRRVIAAVCVPALALIGAHAVMSDTTDVKLGLRTAICSLALLLVGRMVLRYVSASDPLAASRPLLIVGAGKVGSELASGFLDYGPDSCPPLPDFRRARLPGVSARSADADGLPVLGAPENLPQALAQTGAECVAFAFTADADERLLPLVEQCERLGVRAFFVPRLYEAAGWRMQVHPVGALPLVELCLVSPNDVRFALKHTIDRIVSALLLVALTPLLVAIAAVVKASSPGPVFFRQRRIGRDGREFTMLKFRSMREPTGPIRAFVPPDGCAPGGVELGDRRTPLGSWLRRASLDELPQLINVLRGEMSLIGPRPERPEYVRRFAVELRRYDRRHRVKSGITGLAQVSGLRGQTSIVERAEYDNFYVQNWSFWLDLKIALLTITTVFSFRGQ